jgi:hypothetical protein
MHGRFCSFHHLRAACPSKVELVTPAARTIGMTAEALVKPSSSPAQKSGFSAVGTSESLL